MGTGYCQPSCRVNMGWGTMSISSEVIQGEISLFWFPIIFFYNVSRYRFLYVYPARSLKNVLSLQLMVLVGFFCMASTTFSFSSPLGTQAMPPPCVCWCFLCSTWNFLFLTWRISTWPIFQFTKSLFRLVQFGVQLSAEFSVEAFLSLSKIQLFLCCF